MSLNTGLPALWLTHGWRQRLLLPLAWLFGALVALRRCLYRAGWLRMQALDVPVVVVGNRIAGGAGKTPTLLALVQRLQAQGFHPGIVSRGHGRSGRACRAVEPRAAASEVGDEPLLLRRRARVPVWVGRDRVAAARALRAAHPQVDVVLCDDGLQHLRLARDVEVVVFDERGAGNGALLPAGPLREPVDTRPAAPAALVLYNAPAPTTALPGFVAKRRLAGAVALVDWWAGAPATEATLEALRDAPVVAAAGVARPGRFFDALRAAGLRVTEQPLPDHFDHAELPWPSGAIDVVVTEKDAVKLDPVRIALERPTTRIWVVPLVLEPEPAFFDAVLAALPAPPSTTAS